MNKTVVIYESKYGYTQNYARWIAKALSCPLYERKNFPAKDLSHYEIILYGGGLYAGSVSGVSFLTKNREVLSRKKVILFTCGLANPKDPNNIANIHTSLAKTLSEEMLEHLTLFHLWGGIDYSRLSFLHKSMMAMLRKMLLKKDAHDLRDEDKVILDTYGKSLDFTDPNTIGPLVDYVSSLGEGTSLTR